MAAGTEGVKVKLQFRGGLDTYEAWGWKTRRIK